MDYWSERIRDEVFMFLFTTLNLACNLKALQMQKLLSLKLNSEVIQSAIQVDSKQWDSGRGYIVFWGLWNQRCLALIP